ncbi:MAG TPA: SIS domain-containing protein [Jatrophihabitantaceae bacterium]|jgi:glucose/mannose-6-phosphate isomerase|nr:SIS domain-containing protein [Jatrophihabitantaceae bacterium]
MMFDEALLDDQDLLTRRDAGGLLWALAGAGAQVRRAGELRADFGPDRLDGDRPRAVLLVGDPASAGALGILARLLAPVVPTVRWSGADLPRWAGPADALLACSVDGLHPRLVSIADQAARRGLISAVVAPAGSPVAGAAGRVPLADLDAQLHPRAALWATLTPMLQAAEALSLWTPTPGLYSQVADALDMVAESCRPSSDAFTNPAKALAVEFAETLPVIAGAGPLAAAGAKIFADAIELIAGTAAVPISLPDELATVVALLSVSELVGGSPAEDFFRDRTAEVGVRPRLVLVDADDAADDPLPGDRSLAALREIATARGVRATTTEVPTGPALVRLAGVVQLGLFTAGYLALGLGLDPSGPR